jgi:hypothetical protein
MEEVTEMTIRSATYEPAMRISHDPTTHKVTVTFRGRIIHMPWRCDTPEQATHAGEAYCWQRGWRPKSEQGRSKSSLLRHRPTVVAL